MTINKQALREAAEKATPGEWWIDSHGMAMVAHHNDNTMIVFVTDGEQMGKAIRHEDTGNLSHWRNDNDASFIAAANPATVLALLDELEAKDRRIEEEIGRANREHHRGFMMACGHLKQHSNVHYADASEMEIAALRERIAELEVREVILPQRISMEGGAYCTTHARYDEDGDYYYRDEVIESLVAAGIITKVGE